MYSLLSSPPSPRHWLGCLCMKKFQYLHRFTFLNICLLHWLGFYGEASLKITWKEIKIHAIEDGPLFPRLCWGTTSWRAIPSVSKILSNANTHKQQLHSIWKAEEIKIMKSALVLQIGAKSNAESNTVHLSFHCSYGTASYCWSFSQHEMSHPKRSKYTDSGFLRPHNYPKSVPSSETEGGGFVKDLSRVWRQFGGGGTPHLGGGEENSGRVSSRLYRAPENAHLAGTHRRQLPFEFSRAL